MFSGRQFINYEARLAALRRRIFCIVIGMTLIGLLLIYDASSVYAFRNFADAMLFFKRQVVFVALGIMAFIVALHLNLYFLKKHSGLLLFLGAVLLVLVLMFGVTSGGAKRWLKFGVIGFQPSEVMKIIFLIYLADYFSRKKTLMKDFFRGVLPVLIVTGLIAGLIFMEPDFGNAVFFGFILLLFLFVSKVPKKYLGMLILAGLVVFAVLIFSSPYRTERVMSYLNPWKDRQGAGFQLVQSQIGVGSGGQFGAGLGESKQKLFFLPAAHTDFIFAIIAEELGFFGGFLIIFLYLAVFFQGVKMLRWADGLFGFYLGWGALMVIISQALINIAVVIGIFPTKGLPLPFISYGGSSVVVSYILLGLLFNVTRVR